MKVIENNYHSKESYFNYESKKTFFNNAIISPAVFWRAEAERDKKQRTLEEKTFFAEADPEAVVDRLFDAYSALQEGCDTYVNGKSEDWVFEQINPQDGVVQQVKAGLADDYKRISGLALNRFLDEGMAVGNFTMAFGLVRTLKDPRMADTMLTRLVNRAARSIGMDTDPIDFGSHGQNITTKGILNTLRLNRSLKWSHGKPNIEMLFDTKQMPSLDEQCIASSLHGRPIEQAQ